MTTLLQIKQTQHAARVPVTVFELAGELDGSNYDQLQKEGEQAIEAGIRYVVLDLSQLRYISSAGLRALYLLSKGLSAKSAESNVNAGAFKSSFLKLLNPSPTVHQALDVMGFNMSMDIHSNLDEALASF